MFQLVERLKATGRKTERHTQKDASLVGDTKGLYNYQSMNAESQLLSHGDNRMQKRNRETDRQNETCEKMNTD